MPICFEAKFDYFLIWIEMCHFKEHRTEIDARSGTFQAFEVFGQNLLQNEHYASPDVRNKLEELAKAREELEQ